MLTAAGWGPGASLQLALLAALGLGLVLPAIAALGGAIRAACPRKPCAPHRRGSGKPCTPLRYGTFLSHPPADAAAARWLQLVLEQAPAEKRAA